MTINHRRVGSVVVLELSGTFGAGTAESFSTTVQSMLYEGRRAFVVNLAGVTRMDSTGLGALVAACGSVAAAGGRMVLAQLPRRIQSVLAIAKLVTVFDVFDSEAEALASLMSETPRSDVVSSAVAKTIL
jgi:anti-sigma B factor antagonist